MRMFEWGVITQSASGPRQAPVGVCGEQGRAADRMLAALEDVPAGMTAQGFVTELAYRPAWNRYDRLGSRLQAVREASGMVWRISGREAGGRGGARIAHPARVYDFLLGGKDHYEADRDAAALLLAAEPKARRLARANRSFAVRAARQIAHGGVSQFLDLGSGLPTEPSIHGAVRQLVPGARVAYVDNDAVVTVHNRALLADGPGLTAVGGDIRQPGQILASPELRKVIDFGQPVAVLLVGVLHFIAAADDPAGIIAAFRAVMAPGSYLVISHGVTDGIDEQTAAGITGAYQATSAPVTPRTAAEVARWADGLELAGAGLTDVTRWPAAPREPGAIRVAAVVGRVR